MKGKAACCRQSAQSKQKGLQRKTEMHQVLISKEQAGVQADGPALRFQPKQGKRLPVGSLGMHVGRERC